MRTEPTEEEKKWWRKFRSFLKTMPSTMEVLTGAGGELHAAERGAHADCFNKTGDFDKAEVLLLSTITNVHFCDFSSTI